MTLIDPKVVQAIREWHPGQLVLFWIACLLVWWFLFQLGDTDLSKWRPAVVWSFIAVLFLIIPVSLLTVTWIWFGGKKR